MNFFATDQYVDTSGSDDEDPEERTNGRATDEREIKVQVKIRVDEETETANEVGEGNSDTDAPAVFSDPAKNGGRTTRKLFTSGRTYQSLDSTDTDELNDMYVARTRGDPEVVKHSVAGVDINEMEHADCVMVQTILPDVATMLPEEFPRKVPVEDVAVLVKESKKEEAPTMEGILHKRSPYLFGAFSNPRYFVLQDLKLKWYHVKPEITDPTRYARETPLGIIDFMLIEMRVSKLPIDRAKDSGCLCCPWSNYEFRLHPKMSSRSFDLTLDEPDEGERNYRSWIEAFRKTIAMTESVFRNWKVDSSMIPRRWWKQELILQPQFSDVAQTGDLLLFRTNAKVAQLQRLVTRGQFDHVALIVRFTNTNRLCLLEAMGETGVSLVEWESFVSNSWHKLYSRTVYRRVDFERDADRLGPFLTWMKTVYGKPYKLSIDAIRVGMDRNSRTSVIHPEDSEDRGYFCSELVAKAYKILRLLPEERASAQYWPSVFGEVNPSSSQKLNWTSDVTSVSGEMDILFLEK